VGQSYPWWFKFCHGSTGFADSRASCDDGLRCICTQWKLLVLSVGMVYMGLHRLPNIVTKTWLNQSIIWFKRWLSLQTLGNLNPFDLKARRLTLSLKTWSNPSPQLQDIYDVDVSVPKWSGHMLSSDRLPLSKNNGPSTGRNADLVHSWEHWSTYFVGFNQPTAKDVA